MTPEAERFNGWATKPNIAAQPLKRSASGVMIKN